MSAADVGPTKLIGFYETQPRRSEHEEPIYLFEIMTALSAVVKELSISIDGTGEIKKLEGLANAAHVLMCLLRERDTGWDVIRKPAPREPSAAREPKRKTSGGGVVTLVPESSDTNSRQLMA